MHLHLSATSRSVQAPLDIVRHPRLSGDAKSLLLWALSLQPEERDTLKAIGEEMPFGKAAFSAARKQLIVEGYVLTQSWQDRLGRWCSAVIVSDRPLLKPEEVKAAWARANAERREQLPPPVAPPEEPKEVPITEVPDSIPEEPPAEDERPPEDPPDGRSGGGGWGILFRRPKSDVRAPGPVRPRLDGTALREGTTREGTSSLPRWEQEFENDEPTRILRRIVAKDRRLWMRPSDAAELAPVVAEWLARGATERELHSALLDGLPTPVHCPPKLLMDRLVRKIPPPPKPKLPPLKIHVCAECCDPVPRPGICRRCAGVPERVSAWEADRAERNRRGAALARAAFGPGTGRTAALPA